MNPLEPLHADTLLRVYQLVTTMLALATLGGAWHLKGERALWLWAGAFAAAALTQAFRSALMAWDGPRMLWSVGHLGSVLSTLLVLLGLRVYLGLPLRCRWPLVFCGAVSIGSFTLTALTGQLWPSLTLTLLASAALTVPAAHAALRAWREQRGFPLGLMAADLVASVVVEFVRGLSVAPWFAPSRELLLLHNSIGLLAFIALVIGQALAMLLLLQDKALRRIERLIEIDVLTGLLNRRGFDERLRRLLRRGGPRLPLLALLDLDHFKRINDTHGHAVGDAVLSGVGARLRETLRPQDLAVRLGGEEFAVIWLSPEPGTEQRLGDRLREAIGSRPFGTAAGPLSVTVSVGVALARGPEEAPEALFSRADAALYEAKRAGRDRVVLAG
jgi:diguanylate cyclase (GGDEF)-like protein